MAIWLIILGGLLSIVYGVVTIQKVMAADAGSARMQEISAAIAEGAPRFVDEIGFWSQPGVFSWDRIDPGSALLLVHLPALSGRGADLGCGIGVLARSVLASPKVSLG